MITGHLQRVDVEDRVFEGDQGAPGSALPQDWGQGLRFYSLRELMPRRKDLEGDEGALGSALS